MKTELLVKKLSEILQRVIFNHIRKYDIRKIAVAFSGSLDSSLLAYYLSQIDGLKVKLYTIGYKDSYDFPVARESARKLGIDNCREIYLDEFDLGAYLENYLDHINDKNKVSIAFSLPFYILLSQIKEKYIATGHGADTLFGGFYKYLSTEDLKRDIRKNYDMFKERLSEREYRMARLFSRKLFIPFAQEDLVNFAFSLPKASLVSNGNRKKILRDLAEWEGLGANISKKPKKAFQYSTGIQKRLPKLERYRDISSE